jgi:hypothetical protein
MMTDEMTCPDCAETIKAEAKVCKHCGYRFDTHSQSAATTYAELQPGKLPMGWMIGGGVAIAAACAGLIAFNLNLIDQGFRADNPELEEVAKTYLEQRLSDPGSAQYDGIFSNSNCVTGKINARNGFGGYAGYQNFYYNNITKTGEISPGRPKVTDFSSNYDTALAAYESFNKAVTACISGKPVQRS